MAMKWYDAAAYLLVSAGAITWLTSAWLNYNVVTSLIPGTLVKYVYGLIGLAGIYGLITFFKIK